MTVQMPYGATQTDRNAFQRLRRGDQVQIEGVWTGQDQLRLSRFE